MRKAIIVFFALFLALCCSYAMADLETPQNAHWKEESTAIAVWDAVDGADYYSVKVYVIGNNEELGVEETGTSSLEVDVQQEINRIAHQYSFSSVRVYFTVQPVSYIEQTNSFIYGSVSDRSADLVYTLDFSNRLATPVVQEFDESYIARWTGDPNADMYNVEIKFNNNGRISYYLHYGVDFSGRGTSNITSNLSSAIKDAYNYSNLGGTVVSVSFRVYSQIWVNSTKNYLNSDYSEWSDEVNYFNDEPKPLARSTDLEWTGNGYTAQWTGDPNADMYNAEFRFNYNGQTSHYLTYGIDFSGRGTSNITSNLSASIKDAYNYNNLGGTVVSVSFRVYSQVWVGSEKNYSNSSYSDWSPEIEYYNVVPEKLTTPSNLVWTSSGYDATWTGDPNADMYNVQLRFNGDGLVKYYTSYGVNFSGRNTNSISAAMSSVIKDGYNYNHFDSINVNVSFRVYSQIWVNSDKNFANSDYSEWSEWIYYNPYGLSVPEEIVLSPSSPILHVGNSMYLGKTIVPENAYYTKIDWSTSDSTIVPVSSNGRITGLNIGSADVSATIGAATETVPVTVYDIVTNIESDDSQFITDTAGEIIDDIGNNDNPDINNTDIAEDDVENIHDQILEGIGRGDTFYINWWWKLYSSGHYNSWLSDIYNLLGQCHFACGYDAGFEMCHEESNGTHHTIGNITSFTQELEFSFEMPTLPAVQQGYYRAFSLVRIHDGQVEQIPVSVSNGRWSGKSNRFSDFVLMYNDLSWGEPITCSFTLSEESARIGAPFTFTYALQGGSGSYTDVRATFEFVTVCNYGGREVDYQQINNIGAETGTVTVTPKAGTAAIVRIIGQDAVTGEEFNCELDTGWLQIDPNSNYPVAFRYDREQYEPGDTITVSYSIEGLNELTNGKIWWYLTDEMSSKIFQDEQIVSAVTGTYSFTPTYGRYVYAVLQGEDQNGCPVYAESEPLAIDTSDPVTCIFTLSAQRAQIGAPYTFDYTLSGGSGSYEDVYATFEFVTVCNYGGREVDYQRINNTGSPSGTVTVTPKAGTSAIIRIIGKDAETGAEFNCELDTGWLPIDPNPDYPVYFQYDDDQYAAGDTITVSYRIDGLEGLKNGRIWWYLTSEMSSQIYLNTQEITALSGTSSFSPSYGRYIYAVLEGEDQNGKPVYAESDQITLLSVLARRVLTLPTMLTTIESEAFAGVKANIVVIPSSVTSIADNAFTGSEIKMIVGNAEYLRQYAAEHGISYQESLD